MKRRHFLKASCATVGSLLIPVSNLKAQQLKQEVEPHFFLNIWIDGGMDNSYFFDARPLEMTAKGLMQNYLKEEPQEYVGTNGTSCYMTRLAQPLLEYKNDFSVINGVLMSSNFDGHEQNANYFFSGDPFGGDSFIPFLNHSYQRDAGSTPLDGLISNNFFWVFENHEKMIPLNKVSAEKLVGKIKDPTHQPELAMKFIESRLGQLAQGNGLFSTGARFMNEGFLQRKSLSEKLALVQPSKNEDLELAFLDTGLSFFKHGLTKSMTLTLSSQKGETFFTTDTHGDTDAAKQPEMFTFFAERISKIFKLLKETPYNENLSYFDVTTVIINSEFSRTMRQLLVPIEKTGTDHNPLNNTMLIGGKGIAGGKVIGASDFRSADATLSKAHLNFDKDKLKIMGKPFDFAKFQPRDDLPETFQLTDYITSASVTNTLFSLFKVPEERYWRPGRNLPIAPKLMPLLK